MMNWGFDIALIALLIGVVVTLLLRAIATASTEPLHSKNGAADDAEQKSQLGVYPRVLIRQAGFSPTEIMVTYWVTKVVLAALLPLGVSELFQVGFSWYFLALIMMGFLAPDICLWVMRRRRQEEIKNGLSFFIDMLVAFLQSGMTLAQSFEHAAKYGLPPEHPLGREVDLVAQELEAGMDRCEAFWNLSNRTGVPALSSLAVVIKVGFDSGSSIQRILRSQSEVMRLWQQERGEEIITRKSITALFPMMLVSLPLLIVLVFFPAWVQLKEIFVLLSELF